MIATFDLRKLTERVTTLSTFKLDTAGNKAVLLLGESIQRDIDAATAGRPAGHARQGP